MMRDDPSVGEAPRGDTPATVGGKLPSLANDRMVAGILHAMGVETPRLLGEGGEGLVFAYDAGRVIKVYKRTSLEYLQRMQALQVTLAKAALPFATPQIGEIRQAGEVYYTIEKMLDGRLLDNCLTMLSEHDALQVLAAYIDALAALHTVELPTEPYGQFLPTADSIQAATWPAFLLAKLEQRARVSWSWLERDVPRLRAKLRGLERLIAELPVAPRKALVHGDYSQYNVLLDERLAVSAVLDFSVYTVVGDQRMDIACAVFFPEVIPAVRPSYLAFLRSRAARIYGEEIEDAIRVYQALYSFYNADNYGHNEQIYAACVAAITNSGLD